MFKQLIFIITLVGVLGAFTFAQEQPETSKTDKKECSKESSCCSMEKKQTSTEAIENTGTAWNKVCPVKGGEVEADAPIFKYDGKVYGFCCPGCESKFEKNPEKYLKNLNEDGSEFIGS
jgi:YHS domain-containing protein